MLFASQFCVSLSLVCEIGLSDSIDSAIYCDSKLLSTSGYFTK